MPELLQGPREFPKMVFLKYTKNLQLYKDFGLTTSLMYQGSDFCTAWVPQACVYVAAAFCAHQA